MGHGAAWEQSILGKTGRDPLRCPQDRNGHLAGDTAALQHASDSQGRAQAPQQGHASSMPSPHEERLARMGCRPGVRKALTAQSGTAEPDAHLLGTKALPRTGMCRGPGVRLLCLDFPAPEQVTRRHPQRCPGPVTHTVPGPPVCLWDPDWPRGCGSRGWTGDMGRNVPGGPPFTERPRHRAEQGPVHVTTWEVAEPRCRLATWLQSWRVCKC